ncbi:MAG TPA: non-homologous end-joining DNA ligase [Methanothrix sp.]|nr:non-homologous end-joining DNA ligase [Methanothrix sp.]
MSLNSLSPPKPMLAVSGQPFDSPDWIFEPKIDGTRCIALISSGTARLYNRRGLDITYRYPELEQALAGSCTGCILDGEITVFAEGKPSFHSLAQRDHQSEKLRIDYLSQALPASYVVFDMLFAGGGSLLDLPLCERKQILSQQLQESEGVSIIDFFPARGKDYFSAALKMGIEGAMAKRQASPYQPGKRSQDWIKIKKSLKLDLVVGGYIPGKGERSPYFGGLLLGAYERGLLYYVGRVGSGFTEAELAEITGSLVQRDSPPFTNPPATPEVRWTEPLMVVQVSALEVTEDGHLRAPVFLRRREDKVPEECELSQLG